MIPTSRKAITIPMAIMVLLNALLGSFSDVLIVPLLVYEGINGYDRFVFESDWLVVTLGKV
jgi:hypothetical protein